MSTEKLFQINVSPISDDANTGEVFTRPWIVETILDLINYQEDVDLATLRIVEPACGSGAFLVPIVKRLSRSLQTFGKNLADAKNALRAWDVKSSNVSASRQAVTNRLLADGWPEDEAITISKLWVNEGDFLLDGHEPNSTDFLVGNPPYLRLEDIPEDRLTAYRRTCQTMGGRADLYIGFFERGLELLRDGGGLGFICADRWMKNDYGKKLRKLISDSYCLKLTILMHEVDSFEEAVSAYPAITIIRKDPQGESIIVDTNSKFDRESSQELIQFAEDTSLHQLSRPTFAAARLPSWYQGEASWPWASVERLTLLHDLNERFPLLEDSSDGTRVGIGVATGRDSVFIVSAADVEECRLLPLVLSKDVASGELRWSGNYLINPWQENGLVNLAEFPRLTAYLEAHKASIMNRSVAKRNSHAWWRTIDRVEVGLTTQPKLLFPDMKMTARPVLDSGNFYPHHNLYYVVSDGWDLQVLGGLLISDVAEFFVDCYTVKMRGGTLRFQAQYLRRIRVPRPDQISMENQQRLKVAFESRDSIEATRVALDLYGINEIPK